MLLRVRHTDEDQKGFNFMNQVCLGHGIGEKKSSRNVDRKIKGTEKLYEEIKNGQLRQTKMQLWKNNKRHQVYSRRGCCVLVLIWVWFVPQRFLGGLVFSKPWLKEAGHESITTKGIQGPCPFSFPSQLLCCELLCYIAQTPSGNPPSILAQCDRDRATKGCSSETEPFIDWVSCFRIGP